MKKNKKILLLAVSLVLVVALCIGAYFIFIPKATQGQKNIEVCVIVADETVKTEKIKTDEEFLRGAIEKPLALKGSDSEYGMFVTEVDGIVADDAKKEWWCFSKDGEMLNTGIDSTPIADGEKYEITLSTYE
ncbi:MAG: DUF4430 domain-containing protein [Oscillospiraceae bacterium]